ncbi:MAG: RNA methyltransferase [Candidatus Krumholzibacteriia bacterium]
MTRVSCPVYALLDNVRSAWNVGSMFRTADAAGLAGLYLCGITATPPRADLEKTALGAQRTVPWDYWAQTRDLLRHLRGRGVDLIALECAPDAVPLEDALVRFPACFVVGNEVDGVSDELRALCDRTAMIPMHGAKESLNVAVSFGLMAYASRRSWELSIAPSSRRE